MKKTALFLMLITTVHLLAQTPLKLPLWAKGAPNSNEQTKEQMAVTGDPTLYIYPAANSSGRTIIMCPGGGYGHLAMAHEGHDMAKWFNEQGINYVVLQYRMPNYGHHTIPLSDAEQAMRTVRKHAKEWGVDPQKVGIMGASAGGHLASTLATHFSKETRPDFQILFYPVISLIQPYTHSGSRDALVGKNAPEELIKKYSNELQVTAQTPPAFIMLSDDDTAVPAEHSIEYYLALRRNGVPASLHIYPTGGHGWGFNDNFTFKKEWTAELEKWLKTL